MLKRFVLVLALCCVVVPLAQAQIPTDLADAGAVERLQHRRAPSDFFRAMEKLISYRQEVDPRLDGECWDYEGGNYEESGVCPFAASSGCDACLLTEQKCVDAAAQACGNSDNTNGGCFESRTDQCRRDRNSCWSANGCDPW